MLPTIFLAYRELVKKRHLSYYTNLKRWKTCCSIDEVSGQKLKEKIEEHKDLALIKQRACDDYEGSAN